MSPFTIDKVGWHTSVKGNTETLEKIHGRFNAIAVFLEQKGLVRHRLCRDGLQIGDDFAIRSDDLTDEGLQLMTNAYDKWLKAVDKGKSFTDTTLFDRELLKIRAKR
jgi:hypothetical protein